VARGKSRPEMQVQSLRLMAELDYYPRFVRQPVSLQFEILR
jgi:hypothetical protein